MHPSVINSKSPNWGELIECETLNGIAQQVFETSFETQLRQKESPASLVAIKHMTLGTIETSPSPIIPLPHATHTHTHKRL
jgi:hypothetical protein